MAFTRTWTKAENNKLLAAVKKATSVEEAVLACRKAFPKDDLTRDAIDQRLMRYGLGTIHRLVQRPDAPARAGSPDASAVSRLVSLAKGGKTLEEICNAMDLPPRRVKALVEIAQSQGSSLDIQGPVIGFRPSGPVKTSKVLIPAGEAQSFMVASDIHIGSNHFLKDQFLDFIHRGYEKGIRLCLVPGDILDGCYRHSRWEESHHGFDAQSRYAAEVMPRLPGLTYVGITGNHDETFETDAGLSVVNALPQVFRDAGRQDFSLVGARGGYLHLVSPGNKRGAFVELWHPGKGCAYALSYKLQKHIENYAVGQKPDMVFAGHWHQQCYFTQRGVHAFSSGTWHGGQSAFGRMLGGAPSIGGWFVDYRQTEDGTLREVSPTWNAYYERESPRAVQLA